MSTSQRKLDPRVVRTRQMLRDALMALIPEMGYDAITVQDIADRATLNRTTFYLHYRDKQELLTQIITGVLEELANIPVPHDPLPSVDDLQRVFVAIFDHVARHAPFYRVMLEEPSVAAYVRQMQTHIEAIGMRWLAPARRAPAEMLTPPDLFISFVGAAYLGIVKWWVTGNMAHSSDYMATQFMRLTMGGIQRDFGISGLLDALDEDLRKH